MAVNQKAVKVLNKIFEAGFTEEKAIAAMTMDRRHSVHAGNHGGGHHAHQRAAKEHQREQGHLLSGRWHGMSRGRKICMTDSVGKALFSVPDGGIIRMLYGNGEDYFAVCRYLDETHAEIDGVKYAVREFAQRMEQNRISYAPA